MRVLYVASEVAGFAKTGGLADVAAALPAALAQRGVEVAVALPLYRSVRRGSVPLENLGLALRVPMGPREFAGGVWRARFPGPSVPVFLIEQADLFERDDPQLGGGLYQFTRSDGQAADYPDNSLRFGFFCRAVLEAVAALDFWPDVIHVNDWQTSLIPIYLREIARHEERSAIRAKYAVIRTVCTIHNLAYQGLFDPGDMVALGLPWRLFNFEELEFYGKLNFLKAGLVFADLLTTVSPTYAREIQTPYFGCGLQGVLLHRGSKLTGIVNGVDYRIWDPAHDPHLQARYDESRVEAGKAACKAHLQEILGLTREPRVPLMGMVSRLADQKGLDLVGKVAPTLLREGLQLVILGQGDARYHQMLAELRRAYPAQFGLSLAQDERLAHQIEGGADIFLMPSQYEPCGLSQLYSLKYGTIPVVRATGGLVDTVADATEANLAQGRATGFSFIPYAPETLLFAVRRAIAMYRNDPAAWRRMQRTGMMQDWSWNRSAAAYESLYRSLIGAQ